MVVDADHADGAFRLALEVDHEHVVIEGVELEVVSVPERAALERVVVPSALLTRLGRQFADRLPYGSDDGRELFVGVFLLEGSAVRQKCGEALTLQFTAPPPVAVRPSSPSTSSGMVRASVASSAISRIPEPRRAACRGVRPRRVRVRTGGEDASNGVRFSLATWVTIIFMAAGVVMPLRAKAASARALTSSGTLIWINAW